VSRTALAFAVSAVGVAAFFVGLFGIPGEGSVPVAAVGVLLLLAGVCSIFLKLRHAALHWPHWSLFLVVGGAVALHAYEALLRTGGDPSLAFFLWPLAPYVLCLVVAAVSASWIPPLAGAITALLFDLNAHNAVFVHPTSSTAGLALLFVPLWNLLVFSPLAMLAAWFILWVRSKASANAP
jgi:hypothetical protein